MIAKYLVILSFIAFKLTAQTTNCEMAHTGKFQMDVGEYGIVEVQRNQNTQTEINLKMGFEAKYDVIWIDDCHYELWNKKVIKGESKYGNSSLDILKVEILRIDKDKLFLKLSSNYSDFVTEAEMVKIK